MQENVGPSYQYLTSRENLTFKYRTVQARSLVNVVFVIIGLCEHGAFRAVKWQEMEGQDPASWAFGSHTAT